MKMYKKLMLAVCVLALTTGSVLAQNFSGIATYHSASQMKITMGKGEGHMEISEEMQKQLNKQMQKEYTLKFNATASTWKEVESLEGGAPTAASSGGMVMTFSSGSGNSLLYKNTAEGRYEEEANVFGKPFLVKDELEAYEWELTSETKKIGDYNCQKAIYSRIVDRQMFSIGAESEEEGLKTIKDTINVTAWYTPEIPVTHGPDDYWGLPGLILEVNNGSTTMICSKVVLNPAEGVKLEKPAKGKAVNKEEFNKIQQDKLKEMQEKFSNGNGGFVIKKGGN